MGSLLHGMLFCLLTGLVPYRTGSLARGLAGSLALAAAAFLHGFLQIPRVQCLNVLHDQYLYLSVTCKPNDVWHTPCRRHKFICL